MKHGPLVFLGVLSAVMASWLLTVLVPHFQIGNLGMVTLENTGANYPVARPGEARQGAEVYRAQGCNYCHTQQVLQEPLRSVLTLVDAGTNSALVVEALLKVRRDLGESAATTLVRQAPQPIFTAAGALQVQEATKILTNAGAVVETRLANLGPDLRRGWGKRRTVSRDYLRDQPVMLGQVRFGPDLANVGSRIPETARLLRKLYNARIDMPGSTMPRYTYLFEERKRRPGAAPAPGALALPAAFAPGENIDVVPKPEALQLVAYLLSLNSEEMFYEVFPPNLSRTNTVAASTNALPATNAPAAGPAQVESVLPGAGASRSGLLPTNPPGPDAPATPPTQP